MKNELVIALSILIMTWSLLFKVKYNLEIGLAVALIWGVFMTLFFPEKKIDENETYY